MSEETPMLYGIEINEPYQVNAEYKFRCFISVGDDYSMSWCRGEDPDGVKPNRTFCSPHKEAVQEIADSLSESWGAQVVPVEGGVERGNDVIHDVVRAFRERQRTRAKQAREIR